MASRFIETHVDLRVPQSGCVRKTLSMLHYNSKIGCGYITVPEGLDTDLGSIPRALQGLFPKDGKAVLAYILHDYLYKVGKYDRAKCDDILEEAMESLDVNWFTRKSVRVGLQLGGWYSWNKHRKKDNK